MQVNQVQENVQAMLSWQGVLSQTMSMELGGQVLNALKECDSLTVNLDQVVSLDFACLVLLCTLKRHANEKGKGLHLEGMGNSAVAPVVQRFRNNGNRLCRAYCGNSCLFDAEN